MRSRFLKFVVFPSFFYLLFFIILTYPAILSFSNSLWADTGDGFQNVWNIWWVNKAVTQLHQTVWKTNFLHYPYGTSLIGHTLNPLNGIIAIPLLKFFSLTTAYNIILTFAFVFAGVTAFWLTLYLCRSYWPSLVAGYIYTFSQFHFAHAEGHLQTVSMQWIPLFLLSWLLFLRRPNILLAIASAVILYFNLLSDYYFFFYSVLTAVILCFWQKIGKKFILPIFIFLIVSIITSGKILAALILQNKLDPLLGSHPADMFSVDLLSIFIPGGHWRFAELTSSFWSKLPGNIHEGSVAIGISVVVMLIYVGMRSHPGKSRFNRDASRIPLGFWTSQNDSVAVWYFIFLLFLIFSFGPNLQIFGIKINNFPMPYGIAEKILPLISLSGMPVRMMVMVVLSAAILFAFGLKYLLTTSFKNKIIVLAFLIALFIEYLPKQLPQTKNILPAFVQKLKNLPDGGVIDTISSPTEALYYQTIHEKPLALGYIARIPQSVAVNDLILRYLVSQEDYSSICQDFDIRYLLTRAKEKNLAKAKILYQDDTTTLYDLMPLQDTVQKCQKRQEEE